MRMTRKRISRTPIGAKAAERRKNMGEAGQLFWQRVRAGALGVKANRTRVLFEKYIVDFYFPAWKVAVVIDGGESPILSSLDKIYDVRIVHVGSDEILENIESVIDRIVDEAKEHGKGRFYPDRDFLRNGANYETRREMRKNMSEAEKLLWSRLRRKGLGVRARRKQILNGRVVDFYIPAWKLVIEVGEKQYSNSWLEKLQDKGFVIVSVEEGEILVDPDKTVREIVKIWEKETGLKS